MYPKPSQSGKAGTYHSREQAAFAEAQYDPYCGKAPEAIDQAHESRHYTPYENQKSEPAIGTYALEHPIRWQLNDDVANERSDGQDARKRDH